MKDFYYILGTDVNCSSIEIKEAYRKLSKKFHPDLNQNDQYFENRFKEIQEAYEVLNDPIKRARYDAALNKFKKGQTTRAFSANGPSTYKTRPSTINKTRRGIDIAFTLILIAITCIFGDYVIKAINPPEKVNPQPAVTAIPAVAVVKTKHRKKKHNVLPQAIVALPKVITPIKPVKVVKADAIKLQARPAQINRLEPKSVKIIAVSNNSLYTTMVKANATGIINMHEQDNLSSEIVQQIPHYSKVDVLERGDRYYKIRYNNTTGYVPKWTLQTK